MNTNFPLVPVVSVLVSLALGCAPVDGGDDSEPVRSVSTVCGRTHCDEVRSECTAEWAEYAANARWVGLIPDSEYSWCGSVCNGIANYCVREDFVIEIGPRDEDVYEACGEYFARCLPTVGNWREECEFWADVAGPSMLEVLAQQCDASPVEPTLELSSYIESSLNACGERGYSDDWFFEDYGDYFRDSIIDVVVTCSRVSCEEGRVDCFESLFELLLNL